MDNKISSVDDDPPPSFEETMASIRKRSIANSIIDSNAKIDTTPSKSIEDYGQATKKAAPDEKADSNAPKDEYFFVLIVCVVLGLVHYFPYSYFHTANEYWMYKFRNTTSNSTNANDRTYLQANFSSLSSIFHSVPTITSNLLLTFFGHKIAAKTRVMVTLVLHCVIFFALIIFVKVNTDAWQGIFFVTTMIMMVLVHATGPVGGAAEYNLITKLPSAYIKGFLHGEAIAGLFSGVLRIISIAISPSALGSAMIYFTIGFLLLTIGTVGIFLAMQTKFFRHYTSDYKEEKKERIRNIKDFLFVLRNIWPMLLLNGLLLMAPVHSVYNLVVSEYYGVEGNIWGNEYFVTVCTYLIPSATNLLGRQFYNSLGRTYPIPIQFLIVITHQLIFPSLMVLSNARPRNHLPVLLKKDWQYGVMMASYSFSKGFMSNMTVITLVNLVPPNRTELAMLIVFLVNSLWGLAFSPMGLIAVSLL